MVSAAIVVLTKNGGLYVEELLGALFAQVGIGMHEVILIDSGSTDDTLTVAAEFPVRVEKIPARDFHHARTRNFAGSLVNSDVLVFLSQDAIPASNMWLTALLETFSDPRVGAVYGRQIARQNSSAERRDVFDTIYGEQRLVKDPALGNQLGYRFFHFSDANSAIRRSVWEATRFPEDLAVFEDIGIAKRILDAGWKIVYEPNAAVFHSHYHSTLGLFKRYFDIGFTLQRLKIWDSPGVGPSMLRDAGKLLKRKLSSGGTAGPAPGRIWQDAAKSLGFILGLNERYLPLSLKRHLSAHQIYEKAAAS
ncbi:MAG TPA: glycosyltransferase [Candidatus Binatia bacterium]|nr:glycosyltransferase [Candidatus Binatia bacterium]